MYGKLELFKQNNSKKFYDYFKKLNEDWNYYFNENIKSSFPEYNEGRYECELDLRLVQSNKNLLNLIQSRYGNIDWCIAEYLIMTREFLSKVLEYKSPVYWVNFLPNFVYKPLLTFERAINQRGVFVYQPYFLFTDGVYNFKVLMKQRIWPDIAVVIENKDEILKDLDFMGINKKFIYSDFDHIAEYIKDTNRKK